MTKNTIDKFQDSEVLTLDNPAFSQLPKQQQHLIFHLSNAGGFGRDIFFLQNYEHNIIVKEILEAIYLSKDRTLASEELFFRFETYLKLFYFNSGIHDDNHNTKLEVTFEQDEYVILLLGIEKELELEKMDLVQKVLFNNDFAKPYRTYKGDDGDMLEMSSANFYKNMTAEEARKYRARKYTYGKLKPLYGINTRLVKETDEISGEEHIIEEVMSVDGLYSQYITKIVSELKLALNYTENDNQAKSIQSLIRFYETGDPQYFDEHSINWINDTESNVFFINGFIENYTDPMGIASAFESIVAYKDPIETKRVQTLIDNIQYFEDNLPVDSRFKRSKANAMSASSVHVASFSGQASPQLPLGVILPNSEWIKQDIGSQSVNLANVFQARGITGQEVINEFYLEEYHSVLKAHLSDSALQRINMHEVVGHGLGELLEGVKNQDLGEYMNLIEETRADSTALYYLLDPYLKEIGLLGNDIDIEEYALSLYLDFFTSSALTQLNRIGKEHTTLSQTHMRNRQLIALYVLEKAKESKCIELIQKDDCHYVKINDIYQVKELIGDLIFEIQRIKSEGDYEAAKLICKQYATNIDKSLQNEAHLRYESIDSSSWSGFLNPIFKEDDSGYKLEQHNDFLKNQIHLSSKYSIKAD